MNLSPDVSRRIARFRREIVNQLPRFPNNKWSKEALEKHSLGGLLIHYINWRSRFVAQRPRAIKVEPSAKQDPRWHRFSPEIKALLDKVKRGDDLTPHLSLQVKNKGYTPSAMAPGPATNRWADKDFVRNVMRLYHFHLDLKLREDGFVERTIDEVLVASVSRYHFGVIGIFDHTVFDDEDPNAMPAERQRLWDLFLEQKARGAPVGSPMLLSNIASSGHTDDTVSRADKYASLVQELDPRLDQPEFVSQLLIFPNSGCIPVKPKLVWRLEHLDLGIFEECHKTFFPLREGPN
jgi:hypothetical protein